MRTTRTERFLTPILAVTGFLGVFFIGDTQPARGQALAIPAIQIQNVGLTRAIANLARQAGHNYILDLKLSEPAVGTDGKRVPEPLVTIRWENLTAEQALARLLNEHGLHAVESPITSVTRITFTNQITTAADQVWVNGGTNAVISLMQMQDAPLDKALGNIASQAQLKVVLDPKLSSPSFVPGKPMVPTPTVSLRWEKLTARQAIAALCENYNLVLAEDATTGAVRITPK